MGHSDFVTEEAYPATVAVSRRSLHQRKLRVDVVLKGLKAAFLVCNTVNVGVCELAVVERL